MSVGHLLLIHCGTVRLYTLVIHDGLNVGIVSSKRWPIGDFIVFLVFLFFCLPKGHIHDKAAITGKKDKQGKCTDRVSEVLNAAHNMIPLREVVIND